MFGLLNLRIIDTLHTTWPRSTPHVRVHCTVSQRTCHQTFAYISC